MNYVSTFINHHPQLLKRMVSYQPDDIYGGVFTDPVDQSSCSSLRHEKWKTCHPSGKTNESIPTCNSTMSTDELINHYNQHMLCRNYRAIENHSNCFTKKDKGHIKAQKITMKHALQCATILAEKTSTDKKPVKPEKQEKQEKNTNTNQEQTDSQEVIPILEHKSKKKRIKFRHYLYTIISVLFVVSIIFLFIRYVL